MRKRTLIILLAVIVVFTSSVTVSATSLNSTDILPRFTHISSVSAGLTIDSSTGLASCEGIGCAKANSSIVDVTVQLQQYKNNAWVTLKTWSGTDSVMTVVDGQYYVYKGYRYRTKVSVVVYDADGNYLESTIGTQEKTY